MARLIPLFSGSSGNSYFLGENDNGILIDIGRNCKQTTEMLKSLDISPEAVKAIFVTHEHSDHVKGLRVFLQSTKLLYMRQAARSERSELWGSLTISFRSMRLERAQWRPE